MLNLSEDGRDGVQDGWMRVRVLFAETIHAEETVCMLECGGRSICTPPTRDPSGDGRHVYNCALELPRSPNAAHFTISVISPPGSSLARRYGAVAIPISTVDRGVQTIFGLEKENGEILIGMDGAQCVVCIRTEGARATSRSPTRQTPQSTQMRSQRENHSSSEQRSPADQQHTEGLFSPYLPQRLGSRWDTPTTRNPPIFFEGGGTPPYGRELTVSQSDICSISVNLEAPSEGFEDEYSVVVSLRESFLSLFVLMTGRLKQHPFHQRGSDDLGLQQR